MKCFICNAEAGSVSCESYLLIKCQACGDYKISRNAISILEEQNLKLDAIQLKRWVASYRAVEKVPMLNVAMALRRSIPRQNVLPGR